MNTCEYDGVPLTDLRSHPWTRTVASAADRYYDLKKTPAHIRTSLEDFVPWSHYPAVDALYSLLEALNGPGSALESNDCEFTGPHANDAVQFGKPMQCSGRVMVLFRDLARNVSRPAVEELKNALHLDLHARDAAFAWGLVGTTIVPVRYLALPPGRQLGHELMVSFWAWGSSEAEVMANLHRLMTNLSASLLAVTGPRPPA